MTTVFVLLSVQALLGGFDNLWHHELQARLPQRPSARRELTLHAVREAIYGVLFIGLAWFEWHGDFAALLGALLLVELFVTLADFLEEDRTRRLPPFERLLHTVLTISYGLFLGFLAPVLAAWWREPGGLTVQPHGVASWLCSLYGVGVLAWSVRNGLAALRLHRAHAMSAEAPGSATESRAACRSGPAVLVTGATGFVGQTLTRGLLAEGRRVIVLSRDARQAAGTFGKGAWVVENLDDIPSETALDAVVNLAGERVLGMPWTAARRRTLLASRIQVTSALIRLIDRLTHRPRVLVSASAVGFYGAGPSESTGSLDESSPGRPAEFQSHLCSAIERAAGRAEAFGVRVVRLRFGVVLGRADGAYPMLALGARVGLGAVLGDGRQPAPWIHLDDAVGLIRFALANDALHGAVNAVAPGRVDQRRFIGALAASLGRRVRLRLPGALLQALLGEMSVLLLGGQDAVPRVAVDAGYRFRWPALGSALDELAAGPVGPSAAAHGLPRG